MSGEAKERVPGSGFRVPEEDFGLLAGTPDPAPGTRSLPVALDLDPAAEPFAPKPDRRPFIPPPPPVSLVTVEDAHLPSSVGWERELDAFYVGLLKFERDVKVPEQVVYKADNFRIVFDLVQGPVERDDLRMLGVIVKSLPQTMETLRRAEIEFARERGLNPGEERLVLMDPVGNWLRISQSKPIM